MTILSKMIYPCDLPAGVHPLAWTLLGFGLDGERLDAMARHLFDDLGARIDFEPQDNVVIGFAVDWPRDPGERQVVSVGQHVDVIVAEHGAVELVAGHLPPGVRLERHTGRLVGAFTTPGLYAATFRVGPRVKYDPMGGDGSPESPGMWIPVGQPRQEPVTRLSEFPATVNDLTDLEKSQLLVELRAWQAGQVAKEADGGN